MSTTKFCRLNNKYILNIRTDLANNLNLGGTFYV